MTVLVVMAMRAEAAPIVAALGADRVDSGSAAPLEWYSVGDETDSNVVVAVNGVDPLHGVDSIGSIAAALATTHSIDRWNPTMVISAGTAGGFSTRGGSIGQVVLADGPIIHHDRRIGLIGFVEYGRGGYPTADLSSVAAELDFRSGPCSTGDSLDAPPLDTEAMDLHGTIAKDMEAAAVAGVAARSGVPFTALKAITDLVDEPDPTAEQFMANLTAASEALALALPRLLGAIRS